MKPFSRCTEVDRLPNSSAFADRRTPYSKFTCGEPAPSSPINAVRSAGARSSTNAASAASGRDHRDDQCLPAASIARSWLIHWLFP